MAAGLHGDVASAIGAQVEQMIMQAKKDSEARVSHDLSATKAQLQHMEGLIGELTDRVGRCVRAHGPGGADTSQMVDQAFLKQSIEALEQKWGSEVKALKQDLHRTILAHNHNSDLMRHHRDALDEARRRLDASTQPKAEQVDAQIEKVDKMLRQGQAKQRALDALTERLTALETQVGDLLPNTPMPGPFPGMMPGMPRGMNPMMAQTAMAQQQPQPKRAGKKEAGDFVDEETRARFLQQARGQVGDSSASSFNAEAPVFVPRTQAGEAAGAPGLGAALAKTEPPGLAPPDAGVAAADEEGAEAGVEAEAAEAEEEDEEEDEDEEEEGEEGEAAEAPAGQA